METQTALSQAETANTTYHSRLLGTLCFGFWNDADTVQLKAAAHEYLELGRRLRFAESIDHGLYFSGLVHYANNELDQAVSVLKEVIENPAISNMHNYLQSAYTLALCYVALDQQEAAGRLVERTISIAFKSRQSSMMVQTKAFEAEIALRTGHVAAAEKWVSGFDADRCRPIMWRFYVPHFTRNRVLLALNTKESIASVLNSSAKLCDDTEKIHHTHFQIISLIQQALALQASGKGDQALSVMAKAVQCALPGGGIRSFLDEGEGVAALLNQLKLDSEALRFVGKILSGFRNTAVDESLHSTINLQAGVLDPLSTREREVLLMLAGPLDNKAIAEKLFISPGTVKRHTNSIYSKLVVHSRRAAVDKARGLGLLGD